MLLTVVAWHAFPETSHCLDWILWQHSSHRHSSISFSCLIEKRHMQAEVKCTRLEEELSCTASQAAGLQDELAQASEQLQVSLQERAQLQSSAGTTSADLAARQQTVMALQQDKHDLLLQLQQGVQIREQMQQQAEAVAAVSAGQRQEFGALQLERNEIRSRLTDATADAGSAHAEVAELRGQLAGAEAAGRAAASEAAKEAGQLKSSLEAAEQRHQELVANLAGTEGNLVAAQQVSTCGFFFGYMERGNLGPNLPQACMRIRGKVHRSTQ